VLLHTTVIINNKNDLKHSPSCQERPSIPYAPSSNQSVLHTTGIECHASEAAESPKKKQKNSSHPKRSSSLVSPTSILLDSTVGRKTERQLETAGNAQGKTEHRKQQPKGIIMDASHQIRLESKEFHLH